MQPEQSITREHITSIINYIFIKKCPLSNYVFQKVIQENPLTHFDTVGLICSVIGNVLRQHGHFIKHIRFQDPFTLDAVEHNGYNLQYIKKPSKEICLIAVKNNGNALKFIKEQTNEICRAAIRQNINAIKYIDIPFVPVIVQNYPDDFIETIKQNERTYLKVLRNNHHNATHLDMITSKLYSHIPKFSITI